MPRIVRHTSPAYPQWFAFFPGADTETPSEEWFERVDFFEWPFPYDTAQDLNYEMGCLACAWAHWYNLDPGTYGNFCMQQGPGPDDVFEDCAYYNDYMQWRRGDRAFLNHTRPMLRGSRAQQAQLRYSSPRRQSRPRWPRTQGCTACYQYFLDGYGSDYCGHGNRATHNRRCYYWTWFNSTYPDMVMSEERRRQLDARRGDYPEEYRSTEGRGECIRRARPNNCNSECPCRKNWTEEPVRPPLPEWDVERHYDDEREAEFFVVTVDGTPHAYLSEYATDTYSLVAAGLLSRRRATQRLAQRVEEYLMQWRSGDRQNLLNQALDRFEEQVFTSSNTASAPLRAEMIWRATEALRQQEFSWGDIPDNLQEDWPTEGEEDDA